MEFNEVLPRVLVGSCPRTTKDIDCLIDELRDRLPDRVTALTELLRNERKVYVHCNVGVNRSPSVVIADLHWVRGWTLDESLDFMLHRRVCNPYVEAVRTAAGLITPRKHALNAHLVRRRDEKCG